MSRGETCFLLMTVLVLEELGPVTGCLTAIDSIVLRAASIIDSLRKRVESDIWFDFCSTDGIYPVPLPFIDMSAFSCWFGFWPWFAAFCEIMASMLDAPCGKITFSAP